MNVVTKEQYSIESVQNEIKAENRVGTLKQLEEEITIVENVLRSNSISDKEYIR